MPVEIPLPATVTLPLATISTRLLAAAILGAAVGFNADRRRRPAGMRLYATASLLGGLMVLVATEGSPVDPALTALAALLSCSVVVGLICLGLILQQAPYDRPSPGLTAAASLALATGIGLAAGRGLWAVALITEAIALIVLKGGRFLKDQGRSLENPR